NKGMHCKYFAWLDEYVASHHQESDTTNTVEVVDPMKRIEQRIASLEMKMVMMESKNKKGKENGQGTYMKAGVFFMLGIIFAYCWAVLCSSWK
ncbi:hypothetical protein PIB30_110321, partial [Stylosanthes scabra]|nr:hypothetical protein [Stylosanthes scabra]